jgi:hypothetical protein
MTHPHHRFLQNSEPTPETKQQLSEALFGLFEEMAQTKVLATMTYEDRKSFLQNSELGIELGIPQISAASQTQVPTDTDLNTED